MSLRSIVKVSHLSNLSDARYCSGMGVEMLGFRVIAGNEYYMQPVVFQDIRGWISGPRIIAELYGVSSSEQIQDALQTYAPDYLELSWREYQSFRKDLTLPCIVHVSVASDLQSIPANQNIAYVLVNEDISCSHLSAIPYPALVKIHSLEELKRREEAGCFRGYVLEGPHEVRPGITNYDQLGLILEALEDNEQ